MADLQAATIPDTDSFPAMISSFASVFLLLYSARHPGSKQGILKLARLMGIGQNLLILVAIRCSLAEVLEATTAQKKENKMGRFLL